MISYVDALVAFVVVADLCGIVVAWVLYREITGARAEATARHDRAEREARERDRALAKLLQPVVRPPTRPVRGFLGHVPGAEPMRPREPDEAPTEPAGGDVEVAAVVVWRRVERGEDAAQTVREVAS